MYENKILFSCLLIKISTVSTILLYFPSGNEQVLRKVYKLIFYPPNLSLSFILVYSVDMILTSNDQQKLIGFLTHNFFIFNIHKTTAECSQPN